MANVNIKFNNKEFLLSCEDGQEDHLKELAGHLNEKFDNLKSSLGNIGENKLLLITSITTLDEYFETKTKIDKKIEELKNLTEKFRELKYLVYEYKEKKENEINSLNEEQNKLKNELEKNNSEYEKIIDKAAAEIENFIIKVNSENPIQ
tara:strand:- start:123 stop:569 length:447 start_codon:yes stop_codon:yes gene_type:complete